MGLYIQIPLLLAYIGFEVKQDFDTTSKSNLYLVENSNESIFKMWFGFA